MNFYETLDCPLCLKKGKIKIIHDKEQKSDLSWVLNCLEECPACSGVGSFKVKYENK